MELNNNLQKKTKQITIKLVKLNGRTKMEDLF